MFFNFKRYRDYRQAYAKNFIKNRVFSTATVTTAKSIYNKVFYR